MAAAEHDDSPYAHLLGDTGDKAKKSYDAAQLGIGGTLAESVPVDGGSVGDRLG